MEIKNSTIENAGYGLFCAKGSNGFIKDDIIAMYCGRVVCENETGVNDDEYTFLDCDAGERNDCCFGRYVFFPLPYYLL